MSSRHFRFPETAAAVVAGSLFGAVSFWLFGGIREIDVHYFAIIPRSIPAAGGWAAAIAGGLAALFLTFRLPGRQLLLALTPVLPLACFLGRPPGFAATVYYAAALAFLVFRLTALLPRFRFRPKSGSFYFSLLLLLTAGFVASGIYIHLEAWARQFMLFPDWGLFTEIAWNTWQGDSFRSYWHDGANFMGDHFEPGFWLFFLPLIRLFPSPVTTAVTGCLILWGCALLLYCFARSRRLPPGVAFWAGVVWLLYPGISNMNLSLFYGFHPDCFFLPVFILFSWAWAGKRYRLAALFFVLSLSLKETNGVFWCGWGICQCLFGSRKKTGAVYAVTGAVYFLVCLKFIIPSFRLDDGNYQYLAEFAGLGGSILEIMFSPFLRPAEFWGRIFTLKNMLFLAALAVPVCFAAFNRARFLPASGLILLFLFLRGSPEFVSLQYWYQTETAAVLLVMTVLGLEDAMKRRPTLWSRLIQAGLPPQRNFLRPLLAALLAGSLTAHYFYAHSAYGTHSYDRILRRPDCTEIVEALKDMIPAGDTIAACPRTGAYFIIRNRVHFVNGHNPEQEWVLYDRSEIIAPNAEQHQHWLNHPEYGLVWRRLFKNHEYYLFRRGAPKELRSPLQKFTDAEWSDLPGPPFALLNGGDRYEAKFQTGSQDGRNYLECLIRLKKRPEQDEIFHIAAHSSGRRHFWQVPLAFGVYPVSLLEPGEVFRFKLALPPDWDKIDTINIKVEAAR